MTQEIVREFQDKHFLRVEKAVSLDKIKEDKAYLLRVLRVGIELESANCSVSRLQTAFGVNSIDSPETYNNINKLVSKVYHDGSINPEGAEVVFKGNSESFGAYHKGLKEVERIIKQHSTGRINNSSTSAHITLLTNQNRALPDAYLANYYQLYRKFSDALLWLTGAIYPSNCGNGDYGTASRDYIVRSGILHYANPLPQGSPIRNTIREIAQNNGKYFGMYFKSSMRWLDNDNPDGFVIEFRFIDRIVQPVVLTSVKCLLEAMLFKSLELSEFGILNIEAEGLDAWEKTKTMANKIGSGIRLTADDKTYLTKKALNLIDFISPNLRSFDGKSIAVLRALANKPISQRYRDGDSDEKIERDLFPNEKAEFKTEKELRRIIQLQLVKGEGAGEWSRKVGDILGVSERMVRHSLAKLGEDYNIHYDKDIRGFILVG
jgi:hypothetical protein